MESPEFILIGKINKPHGLEGLIKIELYLPESGEAKDIIGKEIYIGNAESNYFVENINTFGKTPIIKLKEITSVEEAEKLKGQNFYIQRLCLNNLEEDEFFIQDLIGSQVLNISEEPLGTVISFKDIPNNPLLEIEIKEKSFLLPYKKAFINKVLPESKTILIKDWEPYYEV
ncbi:MAG TPA: ribosome maturation factor RimM [Vampirovibrionales bacterium]